jgi:hypothetical protein
MNMNHEILTPLNAMLGMAGLAVASELSREQLECVAVVRRAGGSLSALLNDLLDIHAIESGKLVCHPADFDLTEILSTISEIAKVSARDKGLSFVTNISPRIPRLMNGDPDLLGQVLNQSARECRQIHHGRRDQTVRRLRNGGNDFHRDHTVQGFRHRRRRSARKIDGDLRVVYSGRFLHHPAVTAALVRVCSLPTNSSNKWGDSFGSRASSEEAAFSVSKYPLSR